MSLGEWLGAQAREFRENNDARRLQMIQCYVQAYENRERDPDAAFAAFTDGKHIAQQLGEPWWVLFYEHERIEALIHFKRDFRKVLDLAVPLVLEVRKSGNVAFPGRNSAYDGLVAAYLGIDAEGYATEIQQAIDYLEQEVPPEPDGSRYLLLARERAFAMECERYQDAYDVCMRELDLAGSDTDQSRAVHFATFTYCTMSHLAGVVGDARTLTEWSGIAEELARVKEHHCERAEALAWQAVAALHNGDPAQARQRYNAATTTASRIKMPPMHAHFEALVRYHLLLDDVPGALATREAELATIVDRGRLLDEARTRVNCCQLRARLGRLRAEDVQAAREAAGRLKQPQKYLSALAELG